VVFLIPAVVDVIALSLINFVIIPKIFRDNVNFFDNFVPGPIKVLAAVIVFGGIGYHINLFSNC